MSAFERLSGIVDSYDDSPIFLAATQKGKPLKWSEARRAAIQRDKSCRRCDEGDNLTVHHFHPRGIGGGNDLNNLVTLCQKCHQNICSGCSRVAPARVPGWAHSEHRVKSYRMYRSLGEIFMEPGGISQPVPPAIPSRSKGFHVGRKITMPWEFGRRAILEPDYNSPLESI